MPDLRRSLDRVERLDISRMGDPLAIRRDSPLGPERVSSSRCKRSHLIRRTRTRKAPWVALPNPFSAEGFATPRMEAKARWRCQAHLFNDPCVVARNESGRVGFPLRRTTQVLESALRMGSARIASVWPDAECT